MTKSSSRINALVTVIETSNPGNSLLVYEFKMNPDKNKQGWSYDPKPGKRIGENYSKLAKDFASDLKDVLE